MERVQTKRKTSSKLTATLWKVSDKLRLGVHFSSPTCGRMATFSPKPILPPEKKERKTPKCKLDSPLEEEEGV
ncbi:hypothetical protein TCAL_16883 [Tigriopus californicus]|uniref:Uncharacterized protein n=1 Tax=Tigriopus californicus TaxID=6832 RepID=A0A553P6N1_TIGCA|nr:hypothetical protein TCAL_16883 [Tigriopus californicus]